MRLEDWPATDNYFKFYGITPAFSVDEKELKNLFLEKSRQFHPDFYGDDMAAQMKAIEVTAFNNKAFKILSQPTERLKYLIQLHDENKDQAQTLPQDFLMEMLELNEQIDEFAFGNNNPDLKNTIETDINSTLKNLMTTIINLVNANQWTEAKGELLKLNYLERLAVRLLEPDASF